MSPDPDPLAAELAGVRERAERIANHGATALPAIAAALDDVPRLLAAVEAVLKQAADWEAERGHPLSEHAERTSLLFAAKYARVDAGVALREAITSKLLSEEVTGG
jgi:hypothetical protein